MYILGVNISHQPSTALLKDGELQWYIENERISRVKDYHIEEPLNTSKFIHDHIDHLIISSFGSSVHDPRRIELVKNSVSHTTLHYDPYTHHKYHAANAFYDSGFDSCVAIVMDGYGSLRDSHNPHREIESTYQCSYPSNIVPVEKHYSICDLNGARESFYVDNHLMSDGFSAGYMFAHACKKFGMNAGLDAGKIMGMAAYGSPSEGAPWFVDGIADNRLFLAALEEANTFQERCNFAWRLQEETKLHTINYISRVIDKYSPRNIVLSGGYFLNCVNNYAYLKNFPNINFYIDPISHDGGTALGSAKLLWYNMTGDTTIRKPDNIYYGPITNAYISC